MSNPKKAFKSGYRFRNFRGEATPPIKNLPVPKKIVVPLKQGYGNEAEAAVSQGDLVAAGQIIGNATESVGSPVHSPVNGTVTGVSSFEKGSEEVTAVVIETAADFTYDPAIVRRADGYSAEWENLSNEKIEELIFLSGAGSLGSGGIPTRFGSSIIGPDEVERVIINAVEDDILPVTASVLLASDSQDAFACGCKILQKVFANAEISVAVGRNCKELAAELEAAVGDNGVSVCVVSDKYPQSKEEVLVPTITGGDFPYGFTAINIGVVVLAVQSIIHIYEAVTAGLPVINRIVPLGGTGFTENVYLRVPVGTPGDTIIEEYGDRKRELRIVCDSLMYGPEIKDTSLPVTRTCSAVYAIPELRATELLPFATPGFTKDSYSKAFPTSFLPFRKKIDTNIHGEERACLSCSFCAEVCPVGILPNLLHRYVQKEIIDESLQRFGAFRCIDCNLCTYVCPSKIPVADLIKKGKQLLVDEGISDEEKIKNDFSLKGLE